MQDFLMFCYYQGMTVEQARSAYKSNYRKDLKERSVESAKSKIKRTSNVDWN